MQVNTDDVPGQTTRADQSAFRMIGVSWSGADSIPVQVRVHTAGGWQPWHTLDTDASHGPDRTSPEYHAGRAITEPEWVGDADGYQIDAPAGANDVRVHLVRQTGPKVKIKMATPQAAADTVAPPIHFRGEWGARPAKKTPDYAPAVKMAFVHHTATSNDYAPADVPSILQSIQAYHMDTNGWDDIGYNFLVDRFGTIWEGRDGGITRAVVGAQTEGFNTGSTGVAVIGDFTNTPASNEAVQSVGALLGWRLPMDGVDPVAKTTMTSGGNPSYPAGRQVQFDAISGHKDGYPTTCPGMLYDQLGHVRQDAEAVAGIATPYPGFAGGLYIGTGNFGGGQTDIVTGAESGGGPHVRTFNPDGSPRSSFFAYPAGFTGGVRVAGGNVDALGNDEIITGAGPSGGPNVKAFTEDGAVVSSFYAYPAAFTGGVYVASGNVDGILGDEIITGAGPTGGPNVKVWTLGGTLISSFMA
ncbi:MAG: peptidoglycan recognition protein, partial [Actinobacteria bacterium]|nr:peptidoglycan recognition protein [Actinomycetota bacterium]